MKREQQNQEKIDALIALLEAKGTITPEWAHAIRSIKHVGEGPEAGKQARKNGDPPDFANNG